MVVSTLYGIAIMSEHDFNFVKAALNHVPLRIMLSSTSVRYCCLYYKPVYIV